MKENKTKYVILGLLSHENCSGYDIKNRIDVALSQFWSAGFGQIYPTLKVLETEGLIHHFESSYEFGPERKVYQITDLGREALAKWLERPVLKEDVHYELLLKMFFGAASSQETALQQIELFKQRNELHLQNVLGMQQELSKIIDTSDDHLYYYLTTLFGTKVYQAYLEWSEEAIQLLKKSSKTDQEV